eukprot:gene30685-37079_t
MALNALVDLVKKRCRELGPWRLARNTLGVSTFVFVSVFYPLRTAYGPSMKPTLDEGLNFLIADRASSSSDSPIQKHVVVVPAGHVFVVGDNLGNSEDSRHFGSISTKKILMKVRYKLSLKYPFFVPLPPPPTTLQTEQSTTSAR